MTRLMATVTTTKNSTSPWIMVMSLDRTEVTTSHPSPRMPTRLSMTIVPLRRWANWLPMTVSGALAAFLRACRMTTRAEEPPLAQAVRM